ncbi:macrosialin [Myripristis murdjan]|uniref:macrosialin n=1 Tax=Myripristis murdjan TaxID=586833 RepID=UPI001176067F|nr:macrosialin-like [Myripristis murdjan]
MKGALLLLLVGCAVSALASQEVNERSNPSATVSPGLKFSPTPGPGQTTTTTTAKTTTTSTTKSTPPPPPKPTPSANVTAGDYSVKTKDGVTCMMAHMAVQIRVATKVKGIFTVQPNLTRVEGTCDKTKVNFTLTFKEGAITFMFNKSVAENTVYVNALSFSLSYPFASKGDSPYVANNKSVHLFPAKIGHSYSCKNESLYMGNGLYLEVSHDRMQAFNFTNNKDFGPSDLCPADRPDYRVAVAVGVTLLVLIVIVVVAYLLGRRRRTDGYQTL